MESGYTVPANAAILVDTAAILAEIGEGVGTTLDAMTIDIQTKIGTPAGADMSADILALDTKLGTPAGADVSADILGLDTKLGTPAGADVSADILALDTKLGTPAGADVSADIAAVVTQIGTPVGADISADIASLDTKLGTPAGADVSADILALDTKLGTPAGADVSVDIAAIVTQIGTPVGADISADIAAVQAASDRAAKKITFNEPVVVHNGLLGSGVVVTSVATPGTASAGTWEIIAFKTIELGNDFAVEQAVAELNWNLTGTAVGGAGSGQCKWGIQSVLPVLNAAPNAATDITAAIAVNVGANAYAYGPGAVPQNALSSLGSLSTFYLVLSAIVTTATDQIVGTINDDSELEITVRS